MKVYAIEKAPIGNGVALITFPSKKAFEATESWVDERWVRVATSNDLGAYELPYSGSMIVMSDEQIAAHNLLHRIYKENA